MVTKINTIPNTIILTSIEVYYSVRFFLHCRKRNQKKKSKKEIKKKRNQKKKSTKYSRCKLQNWWTKVLSRMIQPTDFIT